MSALDRHVFIGFTSVGDGRYRPVTERRSALFGLVVSGTEVGGASGAYGSVTPYETPPAGRRYARFDVRASADPYSPEQAIDPRNAGNLGDAWFSEDGYTPECAIGLAPAFLSAFAASYSASLLSAWSGTERLTSVAASDGRVAFSFDPPSPLRRYEDGFDARVELGIEFHLRSIRGVQVRGGGAGWLPDVLVLPLLVSLSPDPAAATTHVDAASTLGVPCPACGEPTPLRDIRESWAGGHRRADSRTFVHATRTCTVAVADASDLVREAMAPRR